MSSNSASRSRIDFYPPLLPLLPLVPCRTNVQWLPDTIAWLLRQRHLSLRGLTRCSEDDAIGAARAPRERFRCSITCALLLLIVVANPMSSRWHSSTRKQGWNRDETARGWSTANYEGTGSEWDIRVDFSVQRAFRSSETADKRADFSTGIARTRSAFSARFSLTSFNLYPIMSRKNGEPASGDRQLISVRGVWFNYRPFSE